MPTINQIPITPNSFPKRNKSGFYDFLTGLPAAPREAKNLQFKSWSDSYEFKECGIFNCMVIEPDVCCSTLLKTWINHLFPEINHLANVENLQDARKAFLHHELDLVFADAGVIEDINAINGGKNPFQVISMSDKLEDAVQAIRQNICGFIPKPLDQKSFSVSVQCALNRFSKEKELKNTLDGLFLPHKKLLGIPTMEGLEFINTEEIIRCEGLQKCTRIITTQKTDLISSYNIGEFKKLLEGRGFFSCHKSHLINLGFVKKYTREGLIFFDAISTPVPLARRRKIEFMDQMNHL